MNVGMFVANLPACHPLLKHVIARFSTWSGSGSRSYASGIFGGGNKKPHARGPSHGGPSGITDSKNKWLELDDHGHQRPDSSRTNKYLGNKSKGTGVETKIYGDLDDYNSSESLDHADDGSQKRMVVGKKGSLDGLHVNVQRDFRVEITNGAAAPSREVVSKIHADHV